MSVNKTVLKLIKNEKIKYLFWGIVTTVFYFVVRLLLDTFVTPVLSATITEILTIFFAFYVNRRFVFTKQKSKSLVYQLITFFSGRIVVMFADMLITFLAIEKYYAFFIAVFKLNTLAYALDSIIGINYLTGYRLNNLFWICIIQIFAIVFNFIVSKYLSFK